MAGLRIKNLTIEPEELNRDLIEQGYVLVKSKALDLASLDRYIDRFYELAFENISYVAAWEELEKEYCKVFGVNRYDNYESFRTSALRKRGNKKQKLGKSPTH